MKRTYQLLFAFALLGLFCQTSFGARLNNNNENTATISVSGNAEIQVEPDHAIFSFSIETQSSTLDSVLQANDAKIQTIVNFLQASGVEAESIRKEPIDINPVIDSKAGWKGKAYVQVPLQAQSFNPPPLNASPVGKPNQPATPNSFRASRSLSVKVVSLDSLEAIYRGLIERGVYNIGDVSLRSSELQKHQDEVRLKAMQNAKEKAAAMANQLGATLASVKSIHEGNASNDHWRSRSTSFGLPTASTPARISSPNPTPFATTMITVSASANVVFILGDTELDN